MYICASAMAHTVILILVQLLLISSYTQVQSTEHGFISIDISDKGLNFVKDLLINYAVSSLLPLQLPQIEKSVKIPVVGNVDMVLSNIIINQIDISSSIIQPGDTGITIIASGATANLSMQWKYSYRTWLLPTISDKGDAFIQVEGMEIGLTVSLENQQGTLKLSLLDYGCYVEDIFIKLDGGASWLYQGLIDAFEGKISSAVEDAISDKIRDGIINVDSLLQSLPKEILVYKYAAINVTLVEDPVLSNSSVDIEIDGLFTAKDESVKNSNNYHRVVLLQDSVSCENKMVGISLHENVLNSASLAYFNANLMQWVVDKLPDQSLLNTAGWRHIVPKLYKQYPDDDMNLNISLSSPPIVEIEKNNNIVATIYSDMTIDVLDGGNVVPVACISIVISVSGFAEISRYYTLGGGVKLRAFDLSLKWSKIGNLHTRLVQSVMSTVFKTAVLPYVNLRLKIGFPLPIFHGYRLENAQLLCTDSRISICSDVAQFQTVLSV